MMKYLDIFCFRPLTRIHLLLTYRNDASQLSKCKFPTSDEDSSTPDDQQGIATVGQNQVSDL